MIIYFVRHGATSANKEHRYQDAHTVLSPEGEIQAGKVAEHLSSLVLNEIWSSPMTRAKQTAEIINSYHHLEIVEHPELRELKRASILEGKLPDHPDVLKHKEIVKTQEMLDPYFKYQDSESFVDVINRSKVIVAKLEKRAQEVKDDWSICVTTHGILLSTVLLCIILGETAQPEQVLHGVRRTRHENTGISLVRYQEPFGWKVITINDAHHL
jgi:broad specificity phosphatase PhoE